ncbi:Transposon Ty3-I Gag-Pol polyprotein [Araneus ventricosus]|uniref:Transposon Ty3-I Gag-Pol polyprotein n=1 Tax=Araneus ventricosus TaxID=182803 RepID=A0A4Y2PWK1_ARAVE|nr:Transposon Ty3-I Gag-Pol polyprotein [Araneus ventricosus]
MCYENALVPTPSITTQQILSASTDKLASLALTADKIAEVPGVRTCVNSVEVELARLNRLEAQISELTSAVQQFQSNCKRFRNASPHRRFRTRFSSRNRSFYWYHSKFGKKAHKCVLPCGFPENEVFVVPQKNPCSSPIHLVPKETEWRICGDYCRFNAVTEPDRYPLPRSQDYASELCGKTVSSKLDLKRAYYQISVEPEDIQETAQITPCGLYEFLYIPFDLRNAAQTFQRFLDDILRDLNCFVYLDDILMASVDHASHYRDLERVFLRLNEKGLVLNIEKCILAADKLPFLGCEVSRDGISPSEEKVEALVNYLQPQDVAP